jgi:hypothetical protein
MTRHTSQAAPHRRAPGLAQHSPRQAIDQVAQAGETRPHLGAVQGHYDQIAQTCVSFHGDTPEVSSAASSFAGFGKFTCERKAGRGGPVELQGATVIIIGLNDLYIIDAYADAQSAKVVLAAFDRGVGSFKYED